MTEETVSQIGQIACLPARWTDEDEEEEKKNKVREYRVRGERERPPDLEAMLIHEDEEQQQQLIHSLT